MKTFSLDKYYKKSPTTNLIPPWASETKMTLKLYEAVLSQVKLIEKEIRDNSNNKQLSIKKRTLVKSKIAEIAGVDKTNLRIDRQPKLLDYIDSENKRLDHLWMNSRKHAGEGKRVAKPELEKLNTELKTEIEELRQLKLHEYFDKAIESQVLKNHREITAQHAQLKSDYRTAQKTIANMREMNAQLMKELNS